jgi:iron complex outermembrane receptor protein
MGVVMAAEAPTTSEAIEDIVVTGTFIKGTATDTALPVQVLSAEDLEKQGSPSVLEIVKRIPAVQGVIGESNQFGVNQGAGTSNINLRGLGSTRTLVLLNGRRLAASPSATAIGVDTNLLPLAAIGRIEVLKDGAAATYGSDAIAGVVNFITKDDFQGLSVDGNYSYIQDADGDYGANVAWGWSNGASHLLLTGGYRHRSELSAADRDFSNRPFSKNPEGGWSSFGSPGAYIGPAGARFRDPACATLGGQPTLTGANEGCQFHYIVYDNLVEEENDYQTYGKYKLDISDTLSFNVEGLWAMHDVPHENASPSYAPNQGPAGGSPTYVIPAANPGLQALLPFLTTPQQNAINTAGFLATNGLFWRPFGAGGNPSTGFAQEDKRRFDGFRFSTGLSGKVTDTINWETQATYAENSSKVSTPDFLVSRLNLALRGLGGPNCTGTTAGANGCLWLNPFSTGVAGNPATGQLNSLTYTASTVNDPSLINWITTPNSYDAKTKLYVADVLFDGESGISLPGGVIGWAAGVQYRENRYERTVTDDFANGDLTPCPQNPVNPAVVCGPGVVAQPVQSGALSFYGPLRDQAVKQHVYAAFGELSLPILESLQGQLAVRYEDYGGNVGATTNPKLAMRWQIVDGFAMRGSVGTTFRAPPPINLDPNATTTLAFTAQAGGYKPYDTVGNPNLKPEKSNTFDVGFITKLGGFNATVDYWHFVFKDAITAEVGTQLVTAMFPTGAPDHCNDAAYGELKKRFTFAPLAGQTTPFCSIGTLIRTQASIINAQSDVTISGIDASLSYKFDDVLGGALVVGADGSYNLEYQLGANYVEGILIDPAGDAIGTRGGRGGSLPQWKGIAYANLNTGIHNVRVSANYTDGVDDVRVATFATNPEGQHVGSFLTFDLAYNVQLPADITVTATVFNVTDRDPPFARLDLSYDPFLANPLGRIYKVIGSKKF